MQSAVGSGRHKRQRGGSLQFVTTAVGWQSLHYFAVRASAGVGFDHHERAPSFSSGRNANTPRAGPSASQGSTPANGQRSASVTKSWMLTIDIAKPTLFASVSTLPTSDGGALPAVNAGN